MPKHKQNSEAAPKKKGRIGKITSVVLGAIVVLLIVLQVVGQSTAKNNHGVMRYGNYQSLRVLTDSMEPTYKVDTMVFVKRVDPKTLKGPSSEGALDGDVITFVRNYHGSYDLPGDKRIVTHRIHRIEHIAGAGPHRIRLIPANKFLDRTAHASILTRTRRAPPPMPLSPLP
mgnify:CR=1 FL=1